MHSENGHVARKWNHILRSFQYFCPIHLKYNKNANKMEYLRVRSLFSSAFLLTVAILMFYRTYFGKFTLRNETFTYRFLLYVYANIFVIKIWLMLLVSVFYKNDIIDLFNKVLQLKIDHLECKTFKMTTTAVILVPATWNLIYDLYNFIFFVKEVDFSYTCLGFVMICSDYVFTLIYLHHITLMVMFAFYFKQLNEKLQIAIGGKSTLTFKQIMMYHQHFCELVERTVYVAGPYLVITLADCMLSITTNFYIITSKLEKYSFYSVQLLVSICMTIEALILIGIVIIPSELCKYQVR